MIMNKITSYVYNFLKKYLHINNKSDLQKSLKNAVKFFRTKFLKILFDEIIKYLVKLTIDYFFKFF